MKKGDLVTINFGGIEDACIGVVVDKDPHFETRTLVLWEEGMFSVPTNQLAMINEGW
tara:strand:- start:2342 stop:2512 length:171 start_codon:yes stop_codon:yes gene_type:complete